MRNFWERGQESYHLMELELACELALEVEVVS